MAKILRIGERQHQPFTKEMLRAIMPPDDIAFLEAWSGERLQERKKKPVRGKRPR